MNDGVFNRRLSETARKIKNESAAARFPAVQAMLNNMPPTPKEIDLIKLQGPWLGFGYPLKDSGGRYSITVLNGGPKK